MIGRSSLRRAVRGFAPTPQARWEAGPGPSSVPTCTQAVALASNLGEAKFQIEDVESLAEPFASEKKAVASAGGH